MLRFEHPEIFYLFTLLPLFILLFAAYMFRRSKVLKLLGKSDLLVQLSEGRSTSRLIIKFTLFVLAFSALLIGLANPQIGTRYEVVKREGVDVMIALDVSRSMMAEDIVPSRIIKAKQLVSDLLDELSNDRIGLIVFAGNAYLQMPLTVDYYAGKMYLRNVSANMMPSQGTAIGDAVDLAVRSFNTNDTKHKALVIITDGEDHEGAAEESIKNAIDQGVKVFCVGVGSEKGATIPEGNGGNVKKDSNGNIVLTKINEEMLADLAAMGNGSYFNITEANVETSLASEIGLMEGKTLEEKVIADYRDHFFIFLAIAAFLLFTDALIRERKAKLFRKWEA